MAQQTVGIGTVAGDGTGDPLRTAFDKLNDNDTELYAAAAAAQAAADANTAALAALSESIDDRVAALLVAGTNITLTYNDGANTLTIDAAGGGGAPTTADYVVKTADAGLSAERVATDTAEIAWDWGTAGQAKLNLVTASVALSKLANIATARLLGRSTAGSGVIEELTVGSGLSLAGGVLSASGGSLPNIAFFGGGGDGAFTSDGTAAAPAWATKSSGVYTMTRDAYLTNCTLTNTAQINTRGWRLFINGTLNLDNAMAGAIYADGGDGVAGLGAGGAGSAGGTGTSVTAAVGGSAGAGGAGSTTNGSNGTAASGAYANGGTGGGSAAGATGSGGTPGSARPAPSITGDIPFSRPTDYLCRIGGTLVLGGLGGSGGSGGSGNSTNSGGGGGGGGAGGPVVYLAAATIQRDTTTAAGAIRANGGAGGAGGTPSGGTSMGGGGGAGGGGGGWVYLIYNALTGNSKTALIHANGGAGGNGGSSTTVDGASGGTGGDGGRVTLINLGGDSVSVSVGAAGSAGGAPSGTTGGTGGAGGTLSVDL